MDTLLSRCSRGTLRHIIFTGPSLSLVIHPDQVPVRGRTRLCWWAVGLIVESKLELVGLDFIRRSLIRVQENCGVGTTTLTSNIGLYPTCRILLLDKVS